MYVLVAKVLAPVVVFFTTVVSEWSRLRDASTRRQAIRRMTMGAAVAVAVSAGLVVDHGNQTAAVATAQEDAAEAQAARQSIQESLDEQDADLSAARGDLAETQESLSRLEGWAEEAVALMRERDPSLTQQEALARIVEELRELRERSADLEDQLTGLKSYGDMARLNPAGLTGIARPGSGLSESSDLSRALEGAWDVDDDDVHAARCDQAALGKFSGVARKHPTFPFAHYALATCALSNEGPTWRQHAERALAILEHTTQIAGRAGAHDQAYEFLLARLAGEQ